MMDNEDQRERRPDAQPPASMVDEETQKHARDEYLLMREVCAQHWRSAFNNPNPMYVSSSAWVLFTLMWKTWKEVDDEKDQVKYSKNELVQYLPEIKSATGVKSFLDKARDAGFLHNDGEQYWLARSTKLALDRCFDRSIEACLAASVRMKQAFGP